MNGSQRTVEPQYGMHLDSRDKYGLATMGIEKSGNWYEDPRRLVFVLSRYKFVAKMLSGTDKVLEVGCGDAWPVPVILQEVGRLHGVDIDPIFIEDARKHINAKWAFECSVHDMVSGPVPGDSDAAYTLDVLEHIDANDEDRFLSNIVASLTDKGILIVGMPSLESQDYASPGSKAGHINCKSGPVLNGLMKTYFEYVFMFSMNDEVVHTGYYPMAQYLLAVCAAPKVK